MWVVHIKRHWADLNSVSVVGRILKQTIVWIKYLTGQKKKEFPRWSTIVQAKEEDKGENFKERVAFERSRGAGEKGVHWNQTPDSFTQMCPSIGLENPCQPLDQSNSKFEPSRPVYPPCVRASGNLFAFAWCSVALYEKLFIVIGCCDYFALAAWLSDSNMTHSEAISWNLDGVLVRYSIVYQHNVAKLP